MQEENVYICKFCKISKGNKTSTETEKNIEEGGEKYDNFQSELCLLLILLVLWTCSS